MSGLVKKRVKESLAKTYLGLVNEQLGVGNWEKAVIVGVVLGDWGRCSMGGGGSRLYDTIHIVH